MLETPQKNPSTETDNTISVQNEQENPQGLKISEKIKEKDCSITEILPNVLGISELAASFKKIRAEEQRLLEIKQQILAQQHELQNELLKEIEKKKMTIASLISEIPDLQNRTQQLGEVLGVDIYK